MRWTFEIGVLIDHRESELCCSIQPVLQQHGHAGCPSCRRASDEGLTSAMVCAMKTLIPQDHHAVEVHPGCDDGCLQVAYRVRLVEAMDTIPDTAFEMALGAPALLSPAVSPDVDLVRVRFLNLSARDGAVLVTSARHRAVVAGQSGGNPAILLGYDLDITPNFARSWNSSCFVLAPTSIVCLRESVAAGGYGGEESNSAILVSQKSCSRVSVFDAARLYGSSVVRTQSVVRRCVAAGGRCDAGRNMCVCVLSDEAMAYCRRRRCTAVSPHFVERIFSRLLHATAVSNTSTAFASLRRDNSGSSTLPSSTSQHKKRKIARCATADDEKTTDMYDFCVIFSSSAALDDDDVDLVHDTRLTLSKGVAEHMVATLVCSRNDVSAVNIDLTMRAWFIFCAVVGYCVHVSAELFLGHDEMVSRHLLRFDRVARIDTGVLPALVDFVVPFRSGLAKDAVASDDGGGGEGSGSGLSEGTGDTLTLLQLGVEKASLVLTALRSLTDDESLFSCISSWIGSVDHPPTTESFVGWLSKSRNSDCVGRAFKWWTQARGIGTLRVEHDSIERICHRRKVVDFCLRCCSSPPSESYMSSKAILKVATEIGVFEGLSVWDSKTFWDFCESALPFRFVTLPLTTTKSQSEDFSQRDLYLRVVGGAQRDEVRTCSHERRHYNIELCTVLTRLR